MRTPRFRCLSVLLLALAGAAACDHDGPTTVEIDDVPPRGSGSGKTPTPSIPPNTVPGSPIPKYVKATYVRLSASARPGTSRIDLYSDDTFVLSVLRPAQNPVDWPGSYSRTDSIVTFRFAATVDSATAVGVMQAESLSVKFDAPTTVADFEDGVFGIAGRLPDTTSVHIANADGSRITRIAAGESPSWSPDEQRLLFSRDHRIYVAKADGSAIARVGVGHSPDWSPDGQRIVFLNAEGIAVMNADGSNPATLIRHGFRDDTYAPWDAGISKPEWSPDGQRILFEHGGDFDTQPSQIYIMNADGSEVRRVTARADGARYAEYGASWLPEGSEIIYWSYRYGLARVPVDGGTPVSLQSGGPGVGPLMEPSWSVDGIIAFTAWPPSAAGNGIWIVQSSGGASRLLIAGGFGAEWSPSGRRIAFTRVDAPQ